MYFDQSGCAHKGCHDQRPLTTHCHAPYVAFFVSQIEIVWDTSVDNL